MTTPTKLDVKKHYAALYNPPKRYQIIDVPPLNFLMIDGAGSPGGPVYQEAVTALYSLAYPIKFLSKKEAGIDYTVMPLEGLWWAEDYTVFTTAYDKEAWQWRAMIMQPEHITAEMVEHSRREAIRKKGLPALERIRFETFHEGRCAQIMHIGSFADEAPVLHTLHHEFIPAQGLVMAGKHHEIYLSDPARTAPEKLKTVLRQPVAAAPSA